LTRLIRSLALMTVIKNLGRHSLLCEGGAAGSLGAAGPGPLRRTLWSMLFFVDEVLAVAQSR
jgi:hypothetical protein